MQDDVPIAEAALAGLGDRPVRVLLTLGPDHTAGELGVVPPEHTCRTGDLALGRLGAGSAARESRRSWFGHEGALVRMPDGPGPLGTRSARCRGTGSRPRRRGGRPAG